MFDKIHGNINSWNIHNNKSRKKYLKISLQLCFFFIIDGNIFDEIPEDIHEWEGILVLGDILDVTAAGILKNPKEILNNVQIFCHFYPLCDVESRQ